MRWQQGSLGALGFNIIYICRQTCGKYRLSRSNISIRGPEHKAICSAKVREEPFNPWSCGTSSIYIPGLSKISEQIWYGLCYKITCCLESLACQTDFVISWSNCLFYKSADDFIRSTCEGLLKRLSWTHDKICMYHALCRWRAWASIILCFTTSYVEHGIHTSILTLAFDGGRRNENLFVITNNFWIVKTIVIRINITVDLVITALCGGGTCQSKT